MSVQILEPSLHAHRQSLVQTIINEQIAIRSLLARYADLPMSFADACLVRMNELHPESEIWTLDRDFKIYRRNGRSSIPIISPF